MLEKTFEMILLKIGACLVTPDQLIMRNKKRLTFSLLTYVQDINLYLEFIQR